MEVFGGNRRGSGHPYQGQCLMTVGQVVTCPAMIVTFRWTGVND